jgi:hypothetical protein
MPKKSKVKSGFKALWKQKGAELNALKFGIAWGILSAIYVFLMTLVGMLSPGYTSHFTWILMETYGLLGYSISLGGAFLGALYSFIDGFILLWLFALLYNRLVK